MKKKSKALNATEISIVATLVFLISLGAVFTCGDYFAKIFGNNPILSMFTMNRGKNGLVEDITKYLSGITINFGGLNITSPVEDKFTETDGSMGDLQRHIGIIKDYINQLLAILTPLNTQGDFNDFITALTNYQNALMQYTDMDGQLAGEDVYITIAGQTIDIKKASPEQKALLQKALDLDIMLTMGGDLGSTLLNTLQNLPNMNPNIKALVEAFTKDLVSLGTNTDFKVDSRLVGNNLLPQDLLNLILSGSGSKTNNPNTTNTFNDNLNNTYTPTEKEGLSLYNTQFETTTTHTDGVRTTTQTVSASKINEALAQVQIINDEGSLMIYKDGQLIKDCKSNQCSVTIDGYEVMIHQAMTTTTVTTGTQTEEEPSVRPGHEYDPQTTAGSTTTTITTKRDGYFDLSICDPDGVVYNGTSSIHISESHVPKTYDDGTTTTTTTTTGSTGLPADPEKLRDALIDILINPSKYPDIDIKDIGAIANTIDVYRNGTYVDMAENTYNNAVVCTSMGGKVQDGKCTFN